MKPNLFIALEIDPNQRWNQTHFESQLTAKTREWSRLSGGSGRNADKARLYKNSIDYFKRVAGNEEARKAEAEEAKNLLDEQKKVRRAEFDRHIELWKLKGYFLEAEVRYLIKEFADIFSEGEIRKKAKPVDTKKEKKTARPPVLDGSKAKTIQEKLDQLGKKDLYDLLQANEKTSRTELVNIAKELNDHVQKMPAKNVQLTIIQELCGICLDVFKSDGDKAKYDEALRQREYNSLKEQVQTLGRFSKTLEATQINHLLEFAKQKKLDLSLAEEMILEQATKSKLRVIMPDSKPIEALQQCGYCDALNPPKASHCGQCGQPLQETCPGCGRDVPSSNRACEQCGFPVGNRAYVTVLLAEAKAEFRKPDYDQATQLLEAAQRAWPASDSLAQQMAELQKEITAEINKQNKLANQVRTAVQQKRFYKAQGLLPQLEAVLPAEAGKYKSQIAHGIREVETKLKELSHIPAHDLEQRLLFYQTVQAMCHDALSNTIDQKIVDLESEIEERKKAQASLIKQMDEAMHQRRYYTAQKLLPKFEQIQPGKLTEYRRLIEANIKQAEEKLAQANRLPEPELEKRLALYEEVQQICQDAQGDRLAQTIKALSEQIEAMAQQKSDLLDQIEVAIQQNRYYAAQQLLPQIEQMAPGQLSEYRRLVEANIKQVEEKLNQLKSVPSNDLEKRLEMYQQTHAICQDAEGDTVRQKIKTLQTELSHRKSEQDRLLKQMEQALQQKRFYKAQRLLPQLARFFSPGAAQLSEYRQQIEAKIKPVEAKLSQASSEHDPERIVALCREIIGLCSDCQPAQDLLAKTPPSPPSGLRATVRNELIQLEWHPSPCREAKYRLIRRERYRPLKVTDGEQIATLTDNRYEDKQAEVGVPVFYAVFAERDGLVSPTGATLREPVMRLQEVQQLTKQVGNQQVQLQWTPPPNLHQLVVVRSDNCYPQTVEAGQSVTVINQREAVDSQLRNGQRYFYTIFCQFKDQAGLVQTTAGSRIEATPHAPPQAILDWQLSAQESQLRLRWSVPASGQVFILQTDQPTQFREGDKIEQTKLTRYGQLLPTQSSELTVTVNQIGYIYLRPVVMLQGMAYLGREKSHLALSNVTNFRVDDLGHGLRLQWDWPANCHEVELAFSHQGWAEPEQSGATTLVIRRSDYQGSYQLNNPVRLDYYLAVFAVIEHQGRRLRATGETARCHIKRQSRMTLSYQFEKRDGQSLLCLRLKRGIGTLPAMTLLAKPHQPPRNIQDGQPILKLSPTEVTPNSPPIFYFRMPNGLSGYGKLFLDDLEAYQFVTIEHPRTNQLL